MKWLLVQGVIYVVFMVRSTPCQMVNVVCFYLLVWSEHGMKCLNITKYIDIVFYGLFIKKKISNSMVQFSRPGLRQMSSATKNPTKPNFFLLHRIPHILKPPKHQSDDVQLFKKKTAVVVLLDLMQRKIM